MYKSEYKLDVRYYETDSMGIVHHSNYIRYFECGRNKMLEEIGLPIQEIERRGIMLPVVSVEINYKRVAKMGDTLRVITTLESLPKAKLFMGQQIFNQEGLLVCSGRVLLCFVNSETRLPVRAPEFFIEKIASLLKEEVKNC